jgi:hypothetical protein
MKFVNSVQRLLNRMAHLRLRAGELNRSSWTAVGKANLIADSLWADGKINPRIIFLPYGQLNTDWVVPDARHQAKAGVSMSGMQPSLD